MAAPDIRVDWAAATEHLPADGYAVAPGALTPAQCDALRALYDNCGEDEATALKLHKAIVKARLDGFRNNPVKANKIKRALYQLLNDDSEVERIYQIVVEQEEY